jgi:hypothetical protein
VLVSLYLAFPPQLRGDHRQIPSRAHTFVFATLQRLIP